MPAAKFCEGLVTLWEAEFRKLCDGWIGQTGIQVRAIRMSKILAERNLKDIWVGARILVPHTLNPSKVMACRMYRQGFTAK